MEQIDLDGLDLLSHDTSLPPARCEGPGEGPGEAAGADALQLAGLCEGPGEAAGADAPQIAGMGDEMMMPPEPKRIKYTNNSMEHIEHARTRRSLRLQERKTAAAVASAEHSRASLRAVQTLLPGAAQLIGQPSGPALGRKKKKN